MFKRIIIVTLLCLMLIVLTLAYAEENSIEKDADLAHIQYYIKWDESREPEDIFITKEEYLASLEKDKNQNGVLDALEDEDELNVSAASIQTGILGDLNGDEIVDNKDVVLLYRHVAGWEQDINDEILDFNGDGYVNNSDAGHLMKYVSGWPDITLYRGKKNDIVYHLYNESMLSLNTEIANTNPDYYYSSEGLSLKNITADGYIFEGWYDGEGTSANKIQKINVGETGEIELYARWTPRTYSISFISEYGEVATKYYTIETGAILTLPSLTNYIFVGWTKQDDGRFVKAVPKGTFGNLTLVANWASRRNLAKPVKRLEDPIIAEDRTNGKILFLYRLGDIENVPLFTLYRFTTAEGVTTTVTQTEQRSISTTDATTISETVAKATTDSATWTLSEGWNESTSVSHESLQQTGRTREEAETIAKSSTNTYRLDTSVGESDVYVDSSQYAYKGTTGTGSTVGHTTESGQNFGLSVDAGYGYETEISAEATVKLDDIATAKGGAKTKSTFNLDVGIDYSNYEKTTDTTTDSWSKTIELAGEKAQTHTSSKNWNIDSSYSNSNTMSSSHTTSEQISELISNRYGYGSSYSKNGEHSSGQSFTNQSSNQNSYSNTVTYDESILYNDEVSIEISSIDGYYRKVLAGTAHVFGIVGYDIATRSYFTYTFTVMDDETYEFMDYSKTTPNFNDNETGVLPFEIPFFVNQYVNSRIARSQGLEININTGRVTGYSGEESVVIIPSYVDINHGDGTYSSIRITGFETNAFKNNTQIRGIMFSDFMTEIPDSAFEGCTSLRDIYIPNLTHIGNRAFYGCTSLSAITIPENVVSIGANAFYNVNEVRITASNKEVALAAINSGAKSLVLNISSINEEMNSAVLETPSNMDVFEVQGGRKQFENLRIKSFADTTIVNGVYFVDCTQTPLELHSSTVNLNQTTASGSGFCMIIGAENSTINLFGTISMSSSSGKAIVCGNVNLVNSDSSVQSMLQVSGNVYVCGAISNANRYLSVTNGSIITITQEEYDTYLNGVFRISFDANGGTVQETEKTAYCGSPVGTLPTPSRTNYTFVAWYTSKDNVTEDNKVTSTTVFVEPNDIVLYAVWELKPEIGWVKASEAPADVTITQRKYSYTKKYYTTSSNSSMSGWTQYKKERTKWGDTQGPVYSDPSNNERNVWDEQYVTSSNYKTVWHYFRNLSGPSGWNSWTVYISPYSYSGYTYQEIALDYALSPRTGSGSGSVGDYQAYGNYLISGWDCPAWYFSHTTEEKTSDNYGTRWYYQEPIYTYYYYKNVNEEASSRPSGDDISNVVEWVKYREK